MQAAVAAASAALLQLLKEKSLPANLPFAWGNPSHPCFTCLHASLPILVQGVVPGAGTHHVEGAVAVPAVLPAAAVLVPALQLFCQENTGTARSQLRRGPGQLPELPLHQGK